MVSQTVELIKKHIAAAETEGQQQPSEDSSNATAPRKKYSYQEADNAEEFFLPNIWAAAVSVVFCTAHRMGSDEFLCSLFFYLLIMY